MLPQFLALTKRLVHGGDDALLYLRPAEAFGEGGQLVQRVVGGVALATVEVDAKDVLALGLLGQVDEEDLVEAALAQQLWRQPVNAVGGGHDEHGRGLL